LSGIQPDSGSLLKLLDSLTQPPAKKSEAKTSLPHPNDITSLEGSYLVKPVTFCFQTLVQNDMIFINPEQFAKYRIRMHAHREFQPPFPPINPSAKFKMSRITLSGYEDCFGSFVVKPSEFSAQNIRVLGDPPQLLLSVKRLETTMTVSISLAFVVLLCIYSNLFHLCRLK
jgi:hypothetical protein